MGSNAANLPEDIGNALATGAFRIPKTTMIGLGDKGFGIYQEDAGGTDLTVLGAPQDCLLWVKVGVEAAPFDLIDRTGARIASALPGEDILLVSQGADQWVRPGGDSYLDFGRLGKTYDVDPTYDNTAALVRAIKGRRNGKPLVIRIPPGEWRFATADILSLLTSAELTTHRRVTIIGEGAEVQTQGTEEWDLELCTVFRIELESHDDFWMERLGSDDDPYGPIYFENIAHVVPSGAKGSIINWGSDGTNPGNQGVTRQVIFRQCSFINRSYNAHAWLTNSGGNGYRIDRTRHNWAVKLEANYGLKFYDCGFRNWYTATECHIDDAGMFSNCHAMFCCRGFIFTGSSVPGELNMVYAEAPFAIGIYTDHHRVLCPSTETGYPSFLPVTGPYDCDDSGLTWSIDADDDRIELANLPGSYDARDYLMPYTLIEVTPTTANYTDPQMLLIGEVDETGADIIYGGVDSVGNARPCNFPVNVGGVDTGLVRLFGCELAVVGDRCAVSMPRNGRNTDIGRTPMTVLLPAKHNIAFDGALGEANNDTGGVKIIGVTTGGNDWCRGGVTQSGGNRKIDHPKRINFEYASEWLSNTTSLPASRNRVAPDGAIYKYLCGPQYGGIWSTLPSTAFKQAEDFVYRRAPATDDLYDPDAEPWAWRLADLQTINWLTLALPEYGSLAYTIRLYAASGLANGMRFYDGSAFQTVSLASGWQTFQFASASSATVAQFSKLNSAETVANGVWVAWVGVNAGLIALKTGLTASTTQTQGQQPLVAEVNEIAVCANTNDTVTLPPAVADRKVTVINNGAQTLQIFPATGDNLGAGVDTAVTLLAGAAATFYAYDATNWASI